MYVLIFQIKSGNIFFHQAAHSLNLATQNLNS